MDNQQLQRKRMYFTALVTIYVWALLTWQHFHGGVLSHHILHRADLPAISNWWGGLLLPALTWYLLGRIDKRATGKSPKAVVAGFVGALLFGVSLSALFANGYDPSYMVLGLPLIALLLPIYRAEYVLGFVIGMTYTFGVVLPTGFGALVAATAAALYNYLRPILMRIAS